MRAGEIHIERDLSRATRRTFADDGEAEELATRIIEMTESGELEWEYISGGMLRAFISEVDCVTFKAREPGVMSIPKLEIIHSPVFAEIELEFHAGQRLEMALLPPLERGREFEAAKARERREAAIRGVLDAVKKKREGTVLEMIGSLDEVMRDER